MPARFYTNAKTWHDRLPPLTTATSSSKSSTLGGPSDSQSKPRSRTAAEQAIDAKDRVQFKRLRDIRNRVWKEGDRSERRLKCWRRAQEEFSQRLEVYVDNMGSWRQRPWGMTQVNDQAAISESGKRIEKRQKELEDAMRTVETI